MSLIVIKPIAPNACYSAIPLTEVTMMNPYTSAMSYNEYLIKASVEFWTAMAFPALYFAKSL
jgi:hypothetical protein